jgi:hypothetical protein
LRKPIKCALAVLKRGTTLTFSTLVHPALRKRRVLKRGEDFKTAKDIQAILEKDDAYKGKQGVLCELVIPDPKVELSSQGFGQVREYSSCISSPTFPSVAWPCAYVCALLW